MQDPYAGMDKVVAKPNSQTSKPAVDYTQLRIMCLEFGIRTDPGSHHNDVLAAARAYEEYIRGGK